MRFEVDVSGADIFHDDYVICIADGEGVIKGFKFRKDFSDNLVKKWVRGKYRYNHTANKQGIFKVRIYCIILYYLFKSIPNCKEVDLCLCRDFHGRENEIKQSLHYFLEEKAQIKINSLCFQKLPDKSDAHWYAYMMRKDKYNKLNSYVKIELEEVEQYLHKFNRLPKGHETES